MADEKMMINEEELEVVVGGNVKYAPNDYVLRELGLNKYVNHCDPWAWDKDNYYYTWRGGEDWKKVGSEDMVKYVGRTLGYSDPRYLALEKYCDTGSY